MRLGFHSWSRWPAYSDACRRDVQRLLRDGTRLTALQANPKVGPRPREGSWCWRLEALAQRMTGREAVACANATLGLTAALWALDLSAGAEVATTAFSFSATPAAIMNASLRPAFFDVRPDRMTMDFDRINDWSEMKAVVPVDLFGRIHRAGWVVPCVQDACQAVGSEYAGLKAPGDLVVWSFNGRKNVPAGEGGMVLARDPVLAKRARLVLNHAENFGTEWVGTNGHLNELSACVAYHGLKAVKARNTIRQCRAALLNHLLKDIEQIRVFPDPEDHAFYAYPLILHAGVDRDRLVKALTRLGVESQPGYLIPPLHEYPAFRRFRRASLPVTEELSRATLLLLPVQVVSTVTEADIRWLAARMRLAFRAVARSGVA